MTANATHPGRITIPGTDLGVRGTLVAEPQTENMLLELDDRLTLGPVKVDTDAAGFVESPGLVVPIVSGILWLLRFEPHRHDLPDFVLGVYNLNTSGVDLDDLIVASPIAIDETVALDIAAAAALGATNDTATASFLNNAASATRAALTTNGKKPVGQGELGFYVDHYTGTDKVRLAAACADATAAKGKVLLPPRILEVGTGFPLSGYSCGIEGVGALYSGASQAGSGIRASTQSGPVLDFSGFDWPAGYRGSIEFKGFHVIGSGVADATKANVGILVVGGGGAAGNGGAGTVAWRNLAISSTGGPCFDGTAIYLQTFDNFRTREPISAATNDVPYFIGRNFTQNSGVIDLYSANGAGVANVGVGGAIVFTTNGSFFSNQNKILIRAENLVLPTNSTIVHNASNANPIVLNQSDCMKVAGATGTSYVRLAVPPSGPNFGGNDVTGILWGDNGASANVDYGVDVQQTGNRVVGVKGFKGKNVHIATGVGRSYVALQGSWSGATDPGIIDDSGVTTNTLLDFVNYPGTGLPGSATALITPVRKATSTTRNNTATLTADPELTKAVGVGTYKFELDLFYQCTTTADMLGAFTVPSGSTLVWSPDAAQGGSAGPTNTALTRSVSTASGVGTTFGGGGGAGLEMFARATGTVIVTTAGSITFTWAQKVAEVSDCVVMAGSVLHLWQIA